MRGIARAGFWLVTGGTLAVLAILLLGPERVFRTQVQTGEDEHGHAKGGHPEGEHGDEEGHGEGEEVSLPAESILAAGIAVQKVEARPLGGALRATGVLTADQDKLVHVTPRIRGRVEEIRVTLGQDVEKGDVLAILDSVDLGIARANYLKAKATRAAAEANFEREDRLMKQGTTTEPDFLEAKAAFLTADAELRVSRETLLLYGLPSRDVDALTWEHEDPIGYVPIVAPVKGTVIEKHISVGEVVDTSDRVLSIVDLSTAWALLDVFPRDASRVRPGLSADCTIEGVPQPLRGSVTHISDVVRTDTRTIQARVELTNRNRIARPGMFVSALVFDPEGPPVLAIPAEAVQSIEGRDVVFVREPEEQGHYRRVFVTLGRSTAGWRTVLSGLSAGDEVVVSGAFVLKSELLKSQMEHSH